MRALIPLTLLILLLAVGCAAGQTPSAEAQPSPSAAVSAEPTPNSTPVPAPTPTPTPTPPPYDYTAPVPETEAVENDWFTDAVFIGDSRTDGLRLYSGIRDVDFLCYKGLTVFEVMNDKPVVESDDQKIGVLQALEQKEYAKIYLMLGRQRVGLQLRPGLCRYIRRRGGPLEGAAA